MEGTMAEIRIFAGNFAPRNWFFCQGQLLAISQFQALFSLLGTIYGGDGRTTFALPDLRGRVPLGPGNGPGLSSYRQGQKGGVEQNILNVTQLPSHTHNTVINVSSGNASSSTPTAGASIATPGTGSGRSFSPTLGFDNATPNVALNPRSVTVGNTGANQGVENRQPWSALHYIICYQGIFPSRS